MPAPAVSLRGIHKRFGTVQANRAIDLDVASGSIHGIVGENGAGKSTLMSILVGFHTPDSGEIAIDGRPVQFASTQDAIAQGIGMVHQHFMLVDRFSVLENVVLGAEQGFMLNTSLAQARRELLRLTQEFGLHADPDALVRDLPVGALQRVEILKALYRQARILILDEPTGVLTPQEGEQLFRVLRELKARGTTILLITHKLKEILAITDHVTVMRAGEVITTLATAETSEAELAELMVGRKVLTVGSNVSASVGGGSRAIAGEVVLEARDLSWRDARGVLRLDGVSLALRAREIVGVAGVSGNGQSELLALLSGMEALQQGSVRVAAEVLDAAALPGAPAAWRRIDAQHACGPREMRGLGVAHVPEDRHRLGLVLEFPAWESAVLGYQGDADLARGPSRFGRLLLDPDAMRRRCGTMMDGFDVRPRHENLLSSKFSGGNQQKLILAREFRTAPRVLLIGQPTRGVDIGAIELIHQRLVALRDAGCAVLLVSTELDEILALADRIVVMCGGHITGEMPRADADERRLGQLMGQGGQDPHPSPLPQAGEGARVGSLSTVLGERRRLKMKRSFIPPQRIGPARPILRAGVRGALMTRADTLPRWIDHGLLPLLNVSLALLVGGLVVGAIGQSPWQAMKLLVAGAFGTPLAWGYTLYYTTNFIFTGLAVAVAFHAGLFNIGGEGQATVGGLAVGLVLLALDRVLPPALLLPVAVPLAIVAGMAAGVAWAFVPAWLQAWRGSHIVITTIMFNFLASTLMVWLLVNVVMQKGSLAVESRGFAAGAGMPSAQTLLAGIGIEVPATPLNLSFGLAMLACVAVWLLLWRTRAGYALRTVGSAPDAARYAGIDPKRQILLAMAASGALAALVGVNEIAGVHHKLLLDFAGGAGFTGIAVALMGRNHPVGIVLAALLFGALYQGGSELAFEMPSLTRDMVVAVQGFVVLFCGALALMLRPGVVWAHARLAPKPV